MTDTVAEHRNREKLNVQGVTVEDYWNKDHSDGGDHTAVENFNEE